MTRERFEERKQDVRKASARLIESVNMPEDEVVRDAGLLNRMAERVQTLAWD